MAARSVASLWDRFLKLHTEARAMGEHHAAYHALAAALHVAESLEDQDACVRLERLAREHGAWIDANEPRHALSSESAATRGHESVFKQLTVMATSARLRMKIDAQRAAFQKQQGRPKAPSRKAKKRKR